MILVVMMALAYLQIACTHARGTYPHIGTGQLLYIENPPHWANTAPKIWTNDYDDFDENRDAYQYLPKTLVHEFGHTIGLGHGIKFGDVMLGSVRSFASGCMPSSDVLCGLSNNDKKGIRAIYDHHAAHR